MYAAYSSLRQVLVNDSAVTGLVAASNIRVGFPKDGMDYPSISIQKIGGGTHGRLGYGSAAAGSKDKWQDRLFQVDILTRTSVENLELISDAVETAIISGLDGSRITSDVGGFDDGFDAYRTVQTVSFWELMQD